MNQELSQPAKESFENLDNRLEKLSELDIILLDVFRRCNDYEKREGKQKAFKICIDRVFNIDRNRDYKHVLDNLFKNDSLDEHHKDILKEIFAYDGLDTLIYVYYILDLFSFYGGRKYVEKIKPYIFQPLERVYNYLKIEEYNKARKILDYAKTTFVELWSRLEGHKELAKDRVEIVISVINRDKPFCLSELMEIAREELESYERRLENLWDKLRDYH